MSLNYASLTEIYDKGQVKRRENDYTKIVENLIQKNNRRNQKVSNNVKNIKYNDIEKQDYGLPNRQKYSTYPKVEKYTNDYRVLDNSIKKMESKKKNEYLNVDETEECLRIFSHLSKCSKCREYIMKKFNVQEKTPEEKNKEEMLDILIYILTGVFVLFLLDSFMKFGKIFKK
jgi:formylmethanofuran dehydrogenase subunit E